MKKFLVVASTIALTTSLMVIPSAAYAGVSVTKVTAAAYYYCTNSSDASVTPSTWQALYPFKTKGVYITWSNTPSGPIYMNVKPYKKYAIVSPRGTIAKKYWKYAGCPKSQNVKVYYAFATQLFG